MRGLFRRRRRKDRTLLTIALVCVALSAHVASARARASAEIRLCSIEITSPLGRSGLPGKVRIVARVTAPKDAPTPKVRFFVDNALLATDTRRAALRRRVGGRESLRKDAAGRRGRRPCRGRRPNRARAAVVRLRRGSHR